MSNVHSTMLADLLLSIPATRENKKSLTNIIKVLLNLITCINIFYNQEILLNILSPKRDKTNII